MKLVCVLDTGVLSLLVTPQSPKSKPFKDWFIRMQDASHTFVIPEIAYYELRRELVRIKSFRSVWVLDELKSSRDVEYLPINSEVIVHASELWAIARGQGMPTAHKHALDGDVILATQTRSLKPEDRHVIVVTTNKKPLSLFVDARFWEEVAPDENDYGLTETPVSSE